MGQVMSRRRPVLMTLRGSAMHHDTCLLYSNCIIFYDEMK